ncbi:MAG: zeta toxin family protein [Alphaproteobacteria bacterium]|nr:zeta toxin family protein [Alphaproteobacteria bacterium]
MDFPIPTVALVALPPTLRQSVTQAYATAQAQPRPFLLHTIGVPGAGKSSLVRALSAALDPLPHHCVSFDSLMHAIPAYRSRSRGDAEEAFKAFELPAREAGYVLLRELLTRRAHILFDHSGANPDHRDILCYAKQQGYAVMVVRVGVAETQAQRRLAERQLKDGRHTPPAYVAERQALLQTLLPAYRHSADSYLELQNDDLPAEDRALWFAMTAAKLSDAVHEVLAPKARAATA